MKDPTKPSFRKCQHGVMFVASRDADASDDKNAVCSVCTPIKIGAKENLKTLLIKVDGKWENLVKK
jgi:hypothetical protein